jgi:hypothetical protein
MSDYIENCKLSVRSGSVAPVIDLNKTVEAVLHIRDNKLFVLKSCNVESWPIAACCGLKSNVGRFDLIFEHLKQEFSNGDGDTESSMTEKSSIQVPVVKCADETSNAYVDEELKTVSCGIDGAEVINNFDDALLGINDCGSVDLLIYLEYLDHQASRMNTQGRPPNCRWYLKDWHMIADMKRVLEEQKSSSSTTLPLSSWLYQTPACFEEDWLNDWCDHCKIDDYRFM